MGRKLKGVLRKRRVSKDPQLDQGLNGDPILEFKSHVEVFTLTSLIGKPEHFFSHSSLDINSMVQDTEWQQLRKRSWGHSGRFSTRILAGFQAQDTAVTFCFTLEKHQVQVPYRSCRKGTAGFISGPTGLQKRKGQE